jgi:carboxyvinyl-carboxyphosphonate phosphorylmutase
VNIPLIVGDAVGELDDLAFLVSTHARVCLQGHLPFMAGVRAVYETMKALRSGMDPRQIPNVASSDLVKRVSRDSAYQDWIKEFLGA